MRIRIIITLAALIFSVTTNAQIRTSDLIKTKKSDVNKDNPESVIEETTPPNQEEQQLQIVRNVQSMVTNGVEYHYECYEKIVIQNGLWKGVGKPLSEEQKKHKNAYYRLMRPQNAAASSPFTKMQIVDFAGNLSTDLSYEPFIGESDGAKINFKQVCQAEKIFWQGRMVQENMYKADGTLVTQFLVTPLSENEVMGHFINPNGVMSKVRDDEDQTYIYIKYDENGFISQIAFFNEKGTIVKNKDDAYKKLYVYDKEGNQLCNMSGDASGTPVIDNWGNCGYSYTYDAKGRCLTATCIDQFGQPMNMPSKKSSSYGLCKTEYTYDEWGNQTSRAFFSIDGKPQTTTKGIHRYVSEYNSHGQRILYRAEDVKGHLVNYSDNGIAMSKSQFDKDGNLIYREFRDQDSLFTTIGDCIWVRKYKKGKRVLGVDYNSTKGTDTIMNYKMVAFPGGDSLWNFEKGYINVSLFDDKDRPISNAYFDLKGNPMLRYGYHKTEYRYTDSYKHSIRELRYLGIDGKPTDIHNKDYFYEDRYNVLITEVDSVNRIVITTELDGDKILDKFANEKNEDYSVTTALMYYDGVGIRGRTFKSDGFFYKRERAVDAQGITYSFRAVNEFGEPSFNMKGESETSPLYSLDVLGEQYYRDENGDTIPHTKTKLKEYKDGLSKAFCIELVDTVALGYGLLTGDLLVSYGDWVYVNPETAGDYWLNILCYETVRKANIGKRAVVMRHDPVTKTSRLIELDLPAGTPQQLGFIYHMMYMTKAEATRYKNVIAKELQSVTYEFADTTEHMALHLPNTNCDFGSNDEVSFIIPYKLGTNNTKVFRNGFRENAIVLGWEPYLNGYSHFFACNNPDEDEEIAFSRSCDSMLLYYTVDGETVLRYKFIGSDFQNDIHLLKTSVPDGSAIYALADSLQAVKAQRVTTKVPAMKPHEAADQLLLLNGSEKTDDKMKAIYLLYFDYFKNLSEIYEVSINIDSLTYEEALYAKNVLANIDLSDYVYLNYIDEEGEFAYDYVKVKKGKITEIVRVKKNGIFFFLGNGIVIPHKTLLTIKASDNENGYFRSHRLYDAYILLQFNNWRLGKDELDIIESDLEWPTLSWTSLPKKGEKHLGEVMTMSMAPKSFGITFESVEVSDAVFFEALKKAKRIK